MKRRSVAGRQRTLRFVSLILCRCAAVVGSDASGDCEARRTDVPDVHRCRSVSCKAQVQLAVCTTGLHLNDIVGCIVFRH